MNESEIKAVALSLEHWNPLGDNSLQVTDLDGYHTEAIDIISALSLFSGIGTTADVINKVLSEAFELPLDGTAVKNAANEIESILKIKN
jgi:Zn finger protein HypA/HybF involved in hydrogenase expression